VAYRAGDGFEVRRVMSSDPIAKGGVADSFRPRRRAYSGGALLSPVVSRLRHSPPRPPPTPAARGSLDAGSSVEGEALPITPTHAADAPQSTGRDDLVRTARTERASTWYVDPPCLLMPLLCDVT
jgi:hypothetical protein